MSITDIGDTRAMKKLGLSFNTPTVKADWHPMLETLVIDVMNAHVDFTNCFWKYTKNQTARRQCGLENRFDKLGRLSRAAVVLAEDLLTHHKNRLISDRTYADLAAVDDTQKHALLVLSTAAMKFVEGWEPTMVALSQGGQLLKLQMPEWSEDDTWSFYPRQLQ